MSRAQPSESPVVIQSANNPTLKLIRSLRQRKRRLAEGAFVVEGRRAVHDALSAGGKALVVLLRDDVASSELTLLEKMSRGVAIRIVSPSLFDSVAETETPQGILGVFALPELPLAETSRPLFLILDQIRDPGNVGTLLRSAAGAGVTAVILTAACVDPFNDKAVRAGVGAHFRVPIRQLTGEWRAEIMARSHARIVADSAAGLTYDQVDWNRPAALIIGSEASGVSDATGSLATQRVRIPLASGVESLNAAVAGSVILYEAARQRRMAD